ncbi:hypothetical protein SALBM311S_10093 [Streptomyces alboniger]
MAVQATAPVRDKDDLSRRVFATGRDEAKRKRAVELGAVEAVEAGAPPQRVDAVIETVGAATWSHSVKSLKPGGTLVISGATSGDRPAHAELTRIFFLELKVVGSTMGTKDELEDLLSWPPPVYVPSSTRCCPWAGPGRASNDWRPGSSSARSCSRTRSPPSLLVPSRSSRLSAGRFPGRPSVYPETYVNRPMSTGVDAKRFVNVG